MGLGVLFSILSMYTFSIGWEMWRDSLKEGGITGSIAVEEMAFHLNDPITVRLEEPDGRLVQEKEVSNGRTFEFDGLAPGQYLVKTTSRFTQCIERRVPVLAARANEIGALECKLNQNANWKPRLNHSQLTTGFYDDAAIFVTGFRTDKQFRNSYVLFKGDRDSDRWKEIVVPEASGASIGTSVSRFSTGEIAFCTNGRGAFLSKDHGSTWVPLFIPEDFPVVNFVNETPDGKWFAVGQRLDRNGAVPAGKHRTAILVSNDQGASWRVISEHDSNITRFLRHSSGQLLIGTESLYGDAGLFFSQDGGRSWSQASLVVNDGKLRGIGELVELSDGTLLAGTLDGRKWKATYLKEGSFARGGKLLASHDGGRNWRVVSESPDWGDVKAIRPIDGTTIVASEGANLLWSIDYGNSWVPFGKSLGFWINSIDVAADSVIIYSNQTLFESRKEDLVTRYMR